MYNSSSKKVLVGLSGGVDSAVAAYLLQEQGYQVIAGFMKNYANPEDPHCTTRQDRDSALKVASHLGIKTFIIFDFREEYEERIIDYIYKGYSSGITPNPDVFCNNLIKFDLFAQQARELGCGYIATGHYAKKKEKKLYRATDKTKDQSYFLSGLSEDQIDYALFPLGDLTKTQVRKIATQIQLPNADRPDSQGLCFIGKVPTQEFLKKKLDEQEGNILDQEGNILGRHPGAWFYTIGQRHKLFLPFKAYVVSTDTERNTITITRDKNDKALLSDRVQVSDRHGEEFQGACFVKIRYRSQALPAQRKNNIFLLEEESWAIAPGQILVAYDNNEKVLGNGIIQ